MGQLNVHMRGEHAVPIIVAHRTVTREPQIQRSRRFVGLRVGLKALAAKAMDILHEAFWEVENEVLDAGQSTVVLYAIQINDPPGAEEPELLVSRLDGASRPGAGAYFEVINVNRDEEPEMVPPTQPESKAKAVGVRPKRPGAIQ